MLAERKDDVDGFASYLRDNPDNIPKAINFFCAPVLSLQSKKLNLDRQPFLVEMHEDKEFPIFKNNSLLKSKKNIVIYITKLTIAAGFWQWAYNNLTAGGKNLGVVFGYTGLFASLSLNVFNTLGERILHKKPLRDAPGTWLSLFPTVLLYDGMWQIILVAGNLSKNKFINLPIHTLFYLIFSASFVPVQTYYSNRIDAAYPEFKAHTYKPPLAIIPLLTLCYVTFAYLPPLLNSTEGDTVAAAGGVFIGAASWGLIEYLSLKIAYRTLENEYLLFKNSSEQPQYASQQSIADSFDYAEPTNPSLATIGRTTTCDLMTDCLIGIITLPFHCISKISNLCCTLFGNSRRQPEASELLQVISDAPSVN